MCKIRFWFCMSDLGEVTRSAIVSSLCVVPMPDEHCLASSGLSVSVCGVVRLDYE